MAKNILTHKLSNGTIAVRKSTRIYTHVVVADLSRECRMAGKKVGPGPAVVGYTNAGSTSSFERQWSHAANGPLVLEALNGGERG